MEIGQNTYKLILLDTNVLREIVRNTNLAGKGFLQKFFSGKDKYAPCFSIYNALEHEQYEINVAQNVALKAKKCIDRMLEVSKQCQTKA